MLSNGDELQPPGSDLRPGEIVNSNPFGLAGLIERWGGEPVRLGVASDSIASIHEMESGFRRGSRGEVIPRDIIVRFECSFEGTQIFAADFHPAIAANPLLTFHMRAETSGLLLFEWTDQNGEIWRDSADLEVI